MADYSVKYLPGNDKWGVFKGAAILSVHDTRAEAEKKLSTLSAPLKMDKKPKPKKK